MKFQHSLEAITPEKAQELLKCNYGRNRKYRPAHMRYLANEMRNGRFLPTATVHTISINGQPTLINGQHTLRAIIEYGRPVTVTYIRSVTDNPGDLALYFSVGHDVGLGRTLADATNAYDITGETGLRPSYVTKLASALRFVAYGFQPKAGGTYVKWAVIDLVEKCLVWQNEMLDMLSAIRGGDTHVSSLLLKQAILSVGLMTLYYDHDRAFGFWQAVAKPDELSTAHPAYRFRVKAMESTFKYGLVAEPIPSPKLARYAAKAWNNFIDGKDGNLVVRNDSIRSPIVIKNTKFDGNQTVGFFPSHS